MFAGLADFGNAWLGFMNPTSIALGLGGALLGIIVGILPGLSATLVIALLTTITIKLPANNAILVRLNRNITASADTPTMGDARSTPDALLTT